MVFWEGRSTTSHILALRRILEGARQRNLPAAMVFVDFKKAFDSLHRGILMRILKAYGIPDSIVDIINLLYVNTKGKVITPDGDTELFDILAGVLQGDTLAPYLFIIALDYCMRQALSKHPEIGFTIKPYRSRRITYLGSRIRDSESDIRVRKGRAWGACHTLKKLWNSKLRKSIKIRVFTALVESVLLYGSETWTMTKRLENMVDG